MFCAIARLKTLRNQNKATRPQIIQPNVPSSMITRRKKPRYIQPDVRNPGMGGTGGGAGIVVAGPVVALTAGGVETFPPRPTGGKDTLVVGGVDV